MQTKKQKERKSAFYDSIKINVINTIILGGALVFITFLLNNKTEKSKINESFRSEFTKTKAQKIGEAWGDLNEFEAKSDILLSEYKNFSNDYIKNKTESSKQGLIKTLKSINEMSGYEIVYKIDRNRFWIGEEQYRIMGDFAMLIARRMGNYVIFNQDSINKLNEMISQKRQKLDSVLSELLK